MESLFVSTGVVALAEIGDKTQLLSLILAARYRKPLPIVAGIFVATIANHFLAGALGAWIRTVMPPEFMRWAVGGSMLAIAAWTLIPDKFDGEVRQSSTLDRMVHDVPAIIEFVSSVMTLLPGDVILTGTPSGVGPIESGDRLEVRIQGLSPLVNTVK